MKDNGFSGLRRILWPVYRHEWSKFIPMLAMAFLCCFNYSLLKILKDSVVVPGKGGAAAIPFLKIYGILPGAILVTSFYTWLSRRFSQEKVFDIIVAGFLGFYLVYAFLLFPNQSLIHPSTSAVQLTSLLGERFAGLISMYENWSGALFYVMAELWSTMVMTVLFWGFANEISKLGEAKRFYALFGLASNLAAFAAGMTGLYIQELNTLAVVVTVCGVIFMRLHKWMIRKAEEDPTFLGDPSHQQEAKEPKKKKVRLSLSESVRYILSHPYLLYLAVLVVGYNLAINLVEVVWKGQAKLLYTNQEDYQKFYSHVTCWVGLFSAGMAVWIPAILRARGWTYTALLTPMILLVTGAIFFGMFYVPQNTFFYLCTFLNVTPLFLLVFTGSVQNVLSRGAKYSLFDVTKEMAFIPLNAEARLKGKAAIDGVGSRLGKTGGSIFQQILIITCGSLAASVPWISVILAIVIVGWLVATLRLGKEFEELSASQSEAKTPREETPAQATPAPQAV